jgi:hypothetical protein
MAEAADRLEPFLLMARSTKGAAAAKIVQTATAAVSVSIHIPICYPPELMTYHWEAWCIRVWRTARCSQYQTGD